MSSQFQKKLNVSVLRHTAAQNLDADDTINDPVYTAEGFGKKKNVHFGVRNETLKGRRTTGVDTLPSHTNLFTDQLRYMETQLFPETELVAKNISHNTRGFREATQDEMIRNRNVLRWDPLADKSGSTTMTTGMRQAGSKGAFHDGTNRDVNAAYLKPRQTEYTTDRDHMRLKLRTDRANEILSA
jgi:hypothetical protein